MPQPSEEMEIGITGGVEDGVDNSGAAKERVSISKRPRSCCLCLCFLPRRSCTPRQKTYSQFTKVLTQSHRCLSPSKQPRADWQGALAEGNPALLSRFTIAAAFGNVHGVYKARPRGFSISL